jgi:hypothetical protein
MTLMANLKYASFELNPCVFDDREAWVLFVPERGWTQMNLAEVNVTAALKGKAEFDKLFPHLPPLL